MMLHAFGWLIENNYECVSEDFFDKELPERLFFIVLPEPIYGSPRHRHL